MTPLAEFHDVTRRFGAVTAVDSITLDIHPGTLVGLLGPNGAGKTTLLSLLQGLRRPSSGTVRLFGGDPGDPAQRIRLGTTPQETALPDTLRVGEIINFVGGHFPRRMSTDQLVEEFGLQGLLRRQAGALSGGQKRRLSVALAFVGEPALVLLDEPTTGLDVDARHALWQAIRRHHQAGSTVVITSHYLEEIEALAERVIVVDGGRVLADDSLARVRSRVSVGRVELVTDHPDAAAALPGVAGHEHVHGREILTVADADAYVRALVASGTEFRDLSVRGATLEEAFLALTNENVRSAA